MSSMGILTAGRWRARISCRVASRNGSGEEHRSSWRLPRHPLESFSPSRLQSLLVHLLLVGAALCGGAGDAASPGKLETHTTSLDSNPAVGTNIPELTVFVNSRHWRPGGKLDCGQSHVKLQCLCHVNCDAVVSLHWLWIAEKHVGEVPASKWFHQHHLANGNNCRKFKNSIKVSKNRDFSWNCLDDRYTLHNGTFVCKAKEKFGVNGEKRCVYSTIGAQHLGPYISEINSSYGIDGLAFALSQPSPLELGHHRPQYPRHVRLTCLTYRPKSVLWTFQKDTPDNSGSEELRRNGGYLQVTRFNMEKDNGIYTCHTFDADQHLSFHLEAAYDYHTTPATPPIVLVVSPKSPLLTYSGQNVTIRCYSPDYHHGVKLSWCEGTRKEDHMWTEEWSGSEQDAIAILLKNVTSDRRFSCCAYSGRHLMIESEVLVHVKEASPLPAIHFETKERDTSLHLEWQGDTSHLNYEVEKWTVAYQVNSSGPWRLVPGGGFLRNQGNNKMNHLEFQPYSPTTVYRFRIRVARTTLEDDADQHIERFLTAYESPLVFSWQQGPVSRLEFKLRAHCEDGAQNMSCTDWIGDDTSCKANTLMRNSLVTAVSRFMSTICTTCQMYHELDSNIECDQRQQVILLDGILLYPGVHRQQIADYLHLLSDGQLAVTLSIRLPLSDSLANHHTTKEWMLDIEQVCVQLSGMDAPAAAALPISPAQKYAGGPSSCSKLPR